MGLGNPGVSYKSTRHNIGFRVLDSLARKMGGSFQYKQAFEAEVARVDQTLLVKPQTFMNRSGWTVQRISAFYKIPTEDIYVAHDDLDLRLGSLKLQQGKGPKIHNGVSSVQEALGETAFWRLRLGVDNRTDRTLSGEDYVLAKFMAEEEKPVEDMVERGVEILLEQLGQNLVS